MPGGGPYRRVTNAVATVSEGASALGKRAEEVEPCDTQALQVWFWEDGTFVSDTFYVSSQDAALSPNDPKLVVSLRGFEDLTSAYVQVVEKEAVKTTILEEGEALLERVRIGYYKELQHLRELLQMAQEQMAIAKSTTGGDAERRRMEALDKAVRETHVHYFNIVDTLDSDMREAVKEAMREWNRDLMEEIFQLKDQLAIHAGNSDDKDLAERLCVLLMSKGNTPAQILKILSGLISDSAQSDELHSAMRNLLGLGPARKLEDDEPQQRARTRQVAPAAPAVAVPAPKPVAEAPAKVTEGAVDPQAEKEKRFEARREIAAAQAKFDAELEKAQAAMQKSEREAEQLRQEVQKARGLVQAQQEQVVQAGQQSDKVHKAVADEKANLEAQLKKMEAELKSVKESKLGDKSNNKASEKASELKAAERKELEELRNRVKSMDKADTTQKDAEQKAAVAEQKLKDAEQRAADAEQKAQKESSAKTDTGVADDLEHKLKEAEQKLKDAEQRAADAEQKAQKENSEKNGTGVADELEHKLKEAEQKLKEAEQRAADTEQKAQQLESTVPDLELQIKQAHEQLRAMELACEQWKQRTESADERMASVASETPQTSTGEGARLAEGANAERAALEAELSGVKARLEEAAAARAALQQEFSESKAAAATLQQELSESKAATATLQQDLLKSNAHLHSAESPEAQKDAAVDRQLETSQSPEVAEKSSEQRGDEENEGFAEVESLKQRLEQSLSQAAVLEQKLQDTRKELENTHTKLSECNAAQKALADEFAATAIERAEAAAEAAASAKAAAQQVQHVGVTNGGSADSQSPAVSAGNGSDLSGVGGSPAPHEQRLEEKHLLTGGDALTTVDLREEREANAQLRLDLQQENQEVQRLQERLRHMEDSLDVFSGLKGGSIQNSSESGDAHEVEIFCNSLEKQHGSLKAGFNVLDANSSAGIDFQELAKGLAGMGWMRVCAERLFKLMDLDETGIVTMQNMQQASARYSGSQLAEDEAARKAEEQARNDSQAQALAELQGRLDELEAERDEIVFELGDYRAAEAERLAGRPKNIVDPKVAAAERKLRVLQEAYEKLKEQNDELTSKMTAAMWKCRESAMALVTQKRKAEDSTRELTKLSSKFERIKARKGGLPDIGGVEDLLQGLSLVLDEAEPEPESTPGPMLGDPMTCPQCRARLRLAQGANPQAAMAANTEPDVSKLSDDELLFGALPVTKPSAATEQSRGRASRASVAPGGSTQFRLSEESQVLIQHAKEARAQQEWQEASSIELRLNPPARGGRRTSMSGSVRSPTKRNSLFARPQSKEKPAFATDLLRDAEEWAESKADDNRSPPHRAKFSVTDQIVPTLRAPSPPRARGPQRMLVPQEPEGSFAGFGGGSSLPFGARPSADAAGRTSSPPNAPAAARPALASRQPPSSKDQGVSGTASAGFSGFGSSELPVSGTRQPKLSSPTVRRPTVQSTRHNTSQALAMQRQEAEMGFGELQFDDSAGHGRRARSHVPQTLRRKTVGPQDAEPSAFTLGIDLNFDEPQAEIPRPQTLRQGPRLPQISNAAPHVPTGITRGGMSISMSMPELDVGSSSMSPQRRGQIKVRKRMN